MTNPEIERQSNPNLGSLMDKVLDDIEGLGPYGDMHTQILQKTGPLRTGVEKVKTRGTMWGWDQFIDHNHYYGGYLTLERIRTARYVLGRQKEADDGEYRFYFRYATDIEGKGPGATLFDVTLNPYLALDAPEAQVPIDDTGNMIGVSELLQAHLEWVSRYRETGNPYA